MKAKSPEYFLCRMVWPKVPGFCIHFCNPKWVWMGGKEEFLVEALYFETYLVKNASCSMLTPAVICLRKALMPPKTCAARDLLLLHSHTKHNWDPQEPPPLRASSTLLTLPSCPEIPIITTAMLPAVAGGVLQGCRLCDIQIWSSNSAVLYQMVDA